MRGRALLAGYRWHRLTYVEQIDLAEAVWCEPYISGSGAGVEQILDGLKDAIAQAYPDRESWGQAPGHAKANAAAESAFAAGKPVKGKAAKKRAASPKMAPGQGAKPPTVADR